jgi:hypothetical protein
MGVAAYEALAALALGAFTFILLVIAELSD